MLRSRFVEEGVSKWLGDTDHASPRTNVHSSVTEMANTMYQTKLLLLPPLLLFIAVCVPHTCEFAGTCGPFLATDTPEEKVRSMEARGLDGFNINPLPSHVDLTSVAFV
jgi:hypothetical protein